MRALVFDKTLSLQPRWPQPPIEEGDTLIRIRQAGICGTDLRITHNLIPYHGIPGHEFVGTVEDSPDKTLIGQRVAGEIDIVCGRCDLCLSGLSNHCRNRTIVGIHSHSGCFAEFIRLPSQNLHKLPDTLDDDHAIFIQPLASAFQVLKQVQLDSRKWVTVLGAGRLGLLVAQVLRNAGCPVRVVGRQSSKLALCEKWQIRSRLLSDIIPRHDQDIVIDCTGTTEGFTLATQFVRPRGTILLKGFSASAQPPSLSSLITNEITLIGSRGGPFRQAIAALDQKQVDVASLIHRRLRLEQALDAFHIAAQPQTLKVILTME